MMLCPVTAEPLNHARS